MRIHKIAALLCFLAGFAAMAGAQTEIDAFRMAGSTLTGTARSQGMAGAFSAVGADFSAATLNPAGLALYRRAEFQFTPGFRFVDTEARYLDTTGSDFSAAAGIASVSYVYAAQLRNSGRDATEGDDKASLKSFSFGIGYNQIANFKRSTSISAYNTQSSISQAFAERAQGYTWNQLQSGQLQQGVDYYSWLARNAELIIPDTNGIDGFWMPSVNGGNVEQDINLSETGRINEWNISMAGNLDDFIYMGFSLGIQDVRYEYTLNYAEADINNLHQFDTADSTAFSALTFFDHFLTRGTGFNAKLGIIVRPVEFVRVGVSFTSPTWMNLNDRYDSDMTGSFDGDPTTWGVAPSDNVDFRSNWNLTTPYRLNVGGMAMIKKWGFVSADFEVSDYSGVRLASNASSNTGVIDFTSENNFIRENFAFGYNMRLGGEFRYSILRVRAGWANYGSILKKQALEYVDYDSNALQTINGNRRIVTGGFGIKQKSYYIDFAFVRDVSEDRQLLYITESPAQFDPDMLRKKTSNSFLMTIGFTF